MTTPSDHPIVTDSGPQGGRATETDPVTERALKCAVMMEVHAAISTTTRAKGREIDSHFPGYDELAVALLDITDRAENFAHSHAMIANGKGHVEGTQLRYSVDRARRALAAAAEPDPADAGRARNGEVG